ncbi:MAG: 50S ribosomal protein L17 [Saprospirales bacterium]|nr:MAG: 50S ribosomal protein L17 [Saprospirales bacterium]
MRHGKKFNHLKRKKGHRNALFKNMSSALIQHKRITTTLAKAKALRSYLEPLITKAKVNSTHSRRVVFSYLSDKSAVEELFGPIAAKIGTRPGGYLRIIKTGFRKSDGAEIAMIEFVDFNEIYSGKSESKVSGRGRRRRTRRGGSAAATATAATAAAVATTTTGSEEEE